MKIRVRARNFGVIEWLLIASVVCLIIQLVFPIARSLAMSPKPGKLRPYRINSKTPNVWVYLPQEYRKRKSWPLAIFLHGSGGRGNDISILSHDGANRLIQDGQHLDMIAASPQCPLGQRWDPESVSSLVDVLIEDFRVDESQIYLCGFSMGGSGVWTTAAARPGRYAAIVAISGRAQPALVDDLTMTPIRIYHGDQDDVVPFGESQQMAKQLELVGANVEFKIYEGVGHGISDQCLEEPDFFSWLLSKRLD